MKDRIKNTSLSQLLALMTAGFCLLVSLALVVLAATSSQHMQESQQAGYGKALASQIAHRIGAAMESGDLLKVAASLQRFIETSSAEQVAIFDVEGKALGQAGTAQGKSVQQYKAPVRIENDVAGEVVITISNDNEEAARLRLLLSLLGLAILLSLTVYGASHQLGLKFAERLNRLSRRLELEGTTTRGEPVNELFQLARRVDALPMDLLRTRSSAGPRDEHYRSTAALYLHLQSLSQYVDALDEHSLHRYTDRLHRIIYAAAGFYGGELQVSRQFGLVVYFNGDTNAGSGPFRAACAAWLIKAVCHQMEKNMSLSLSIAMAIGSSELGVGDSADIYPGLYMQATLDELQSACTEAGDRVLLSPVISDDIDISARLEQRTDAWGKYSALKKFAGQYQDLLERQLRLILKRLEEPA
ncbi:MAG: putative membrane protein affecting hemolysin expression [Alcanivorax sp.]